MPASWFEEAYEGTPPWDIGRHQPVVEQLADAGRIVSPVLDAGCGTGENALFLASRGLAVVGVDAVPAAVEAARGKAVSRGLAAVFIVHDALRLGTLGRSFRTVVDSGLFHTFDDDERGGTCARWRPCCSRAGWSTCSASASARRAPAGRGG